VSCALYALETRHNCSHMVLGSVLVWLLHWHYRTAEVLIVSAAVRVYSVFRTSPYNAASSRVIPPCPIWNTIWPYFRLSKTIRTVSQRGRLKHYINLPQQHFFLYAGQSNSTIKTFPANLLHMCSIWLCHFS
jgi:hypothetical protein